MCTQEESQGKERNPRKKKYKNIQVKPQNRQGSLLVSSRNFIFIFLGVPLATQQFCPLSRLCHLAQLESV